jgi:hypothetical protein
VRQREHFVASRFSTATVLDAAARVHGIHDVACGSAASGYKLAGALSEVDINAHLVLAAPASDFPSWSLHVPVWLWAGLRGRFSGLFAECHRVNRLVDRARSAGSAEIPLRRPATLTEFNPPEATPRKWPWSRLTRERAPSAGSYPAAAGPVRADQPSRGQWGSRRA